MLIQPAFRNGLVCLVLLAWGGAMAQAQPANYTLDNSHTSLIFGISHAGLSYTYGRFNTVSGKLTHDAENPANTMFDFTVDVASIDTNDKKRDEHLRGPDFFNAVEFPTIAFTSSSVTVNGDDYQLKGNLTLHGVTKEVDVVLKKVGAGKGPAGDERIGFLSQFELKRSDYDMKNMIGPGMIGDEVSITFSFECVKQ